MTIMVNVLNPGAFNLLRDMERRNLIQVSSNTQNAAAEHTYEVVGEYAPLALSSSDWAALMDSIENPPVPNDALVNAMRDFKTSGISWQE